MITRHWVNGEKFRQYQGPIAPIECCLALLRTNNEQVSDLSAEF